MKRSERIKKTADDLILRGIACALLTVCSACLAYAHNAVLYGLALLLAVFAARYILDGLNKRRLAKMERRYEISREIRHNIRTI